jgi:hypothetical protein
MLAQFNSSPIDLLEEIACTVLPQVIPLAVLMISHLDSCATMKSSEAIEDGCKYRGVRNIQS